VKISVVTTYLRRAYTSFMAHVIDVPARLVSLLAFLALLVYPVTNPNISILLMLSLANLSAIFAASWDLLVGRTGQMSLGHAFFFGIGGYSTVMLNLYLGLPVWTTIVLSMLIGGLVALVIGYPCLRVRGPYLALVTMTLPLIATGAIFFFKDWTGGEGGVSSIYLSRNIRFPKLFPFLPYEQQFLAEYYFTLLLLLGCGIMLYKMANSRTGIVFISILDDEVASKACGINTTRYKLMSFSISGFFATLAGAVWAYILSVANMSLLTLTVSFTPIIATIWGGIGTIYGPIAATYILQILDMYVLNRVVPVNTHWHIIIFIIVIIIVILKWPRGLARFVTDKLEDLSKEREIEERGPHIWKTYKKKKA
jgi:branched-chain amino acid transport system permease protein